MVIVDEKLLQQILAWDWPFGSASFIDMLEFHLNQALKPGKRVVLEKNREASRVSPSFPSMGELRAYMDTAMPEETQKVLGVAKRPVITTSTGDPDIWNLTLQVTQ
ncbi:MAG: hypothetical protein A2511_01335 [Deltaproteobacteria bacterium RIFOXYD12_FULL_50_9]|nr:MAG: hypothetical protein A2511_01335 [Deltaproteobacteria bacterium RIFOXYD12_FULL_50_9]